MSIALRPAVPDDYDYCAALYFTGMSTILTEQGVNLASEATGLHRQWNHANVRMITYEGVDIGWIQSSDVNLEGTDDALFLIQLHLEARYRHRGIGPEVMNRMMHDALNCGRAVAVGVAKLNVTSLRMCERLGFNVTREDEHRYYMRLEPGDLETSNPSTLSECLPSRDSERG